jgi:glycosyltransferase involved in cell wall biosynthesis
MSNHPPGRLPGPGERMDNALAITPRTSDSANARGDLPWPLVTVVIPAYNEERFIADVLREIAGQDYPPDRLEIFVVDGGSTDRTASVVQAHEKQSPRIRLLQNPARVVPVGLNMAIREARGEFIVRLDAHASYPAHYISSLVRWHERLGADNVGCAIETRVRGSGRKARAIELVLSSPAGVGGSKFRTGTQEVAEVDTVPFGCYRRDVFDRVGLFDERLTRNQDIEFNKRLQGAGGRIFLVPGVSCTYFASPTWSALARKCYDNGLWNALTVALTRDFRSLSLRHYIPGLLVAACLGPLLVALAWPPAILAAILAGGAYGLFLLRSLLRLPAADRAGWPAFLWTTLLVHWSYGLGSIMGVLQAPWVVARSRRAR